MNMTLVLAALMIVNLGGVGDVLGVSPGHVAGRVTYPNHTSIAVFVNTSGSYTIPGAVATLDAGGGAALVVDDEGRLVAVYDGVGYVLGDYEKSMPPYTVMRGGLVGTVFGLLYPNGTLVSYRLGHTPLIPVARAGEDLVLVTPGGTSTIIASRGRALEYNGIVALAYCGEGLAGFDENGNPVILYPNNTLVTLHVANANPVWGRTLDTSTIACTPGMVAFIANTTSGISVVLVNLTTGACHAIHVGDVNVLGLALDGDRLTLGYASLKPIKPRITECEARLAKSLVAPQYVTLHETVKKLRPLRTRIEGFKPAKSLVAPNIILQVYKLAARSGTVWHEAGGTGRRAHQQRTPIRVPATISLAAVALVAVAIILWLRFGGVRSSSSQRRG